MAIVYGPESYDIMGACFAVYNEMGAGFLEAVYQECLALEFRERGIPYASQAALRLCYRGVQLEQVYVADFVCYDKIIVELKAISELAEAHRAQAYNYLRATGFQLALLVNFGHFPGLHSERVISSKREPG